jgi:hypothetical protein
MRIQMAKMMTCIMPYTSKDLPEQLRVFNVSIARHQ